MEVLFHTNRVEELLHTRFLGRTIRYEEQVDSTNLRIKALAKEGAPQGCVSLAEIQTEGRGRRGRSWHTPKGEALAMSFLLYPRFSPSKASMLSLVGGLSVAQALEEEGLFVQVKWPNDVVLHEKKICGILTEMEVSQGSICYVIVGIGVNVNVKALPEEVKGTATSLYLETGRVWERERIMASILNRMEENYQKFCETEDLLGLKDAYEGYLANCGRQVRIEAGEASFIGTALGITNTGKLRVVREDTKEICKIDAGEVSVRGLYGYVS